MSRRCYFNAAMVVCSVVLGVITGPAAAVQHDHHEHSDQQVQFSLRSARSGNWSDPHTWSPERIPGTGDRVLVSRGTQVQYDVVSKDVVRLIQVVGTLSFARDRDTELNVGVIKVQNSDTCSEDGFACDFRSAAPTGEPQHEPGGQLPALLIGTLEEPIPAQHTARVRLHYLEGMNKDDAPAIACCGAQMDIHGSPLSRTWVKLGADAKAGDAAVVLAEPVSGWRVGDEVIVTGSTRKPRGRTFRNRPESVTTETRTIIGIDGQTLTLDKPLDHEHAGEGEFRSEVANLSRNVIIESADPDGARGHTVYHRFSRGGMSYVRLAHLGKEGVLGRYAIHFHLIGNTMRGSQVLGVAVVDSHNRWVTIHGAEYLVVRDCVGYKSVGHGYFMEDGTEVYNLLDRNLGVQAYRGRRLPEQVLTFDPNDGAAFWWANGRNTLVRNVACENDEYGYRYDMQHSRHFDSTLPVRMPDGTKEQVDVRTIGIWRFEDNESHTEGFYGLVVAANGDQQPDAPIRDQRMLDRIRQIDWTGPDTQHPHVIRGLKIWSVHYALRPHSPSMLLEDVRIDRAAYGIYRPAFENQVYRNLHISNVGSEPFNRGMDDASAQTGKISVDGLTFTSGYGNSSTPLVQISDNNLSGEAETHLRNVRLDRPSQFHDRWPLVNRGVGPRVAPMTDRGVPIYIHDHYGPGRHAKIVSTAANDLLADGNTYRSESPITGNEAVVAEVKGVDWPTLLNPVDDLPPATIITSVRRESAGGSDKLLVRGVSHDNGEIVLVQVNGQAATTVAAGAGVVDWELRLDPPQDGKLSAGATDDSGNVEQTPHVKQLVMNER